MQGRFEVFESHDAQFMILFALVQSRSQDEANALRDPDRKQRGCQGPDEHVLRELALVELSEAGESLAATMRAMTAYSLLTASTE